MAPKARGDRQHVPGSPLHRRRACRERARLRRRTGFLWNLPRVSSEMVSTSLISLMPSPKSVVRSCPTPHADPGGQFTHPSATHASHSEPRRGVAPHLDLHLVLGEVHVDPRLERLVLHLLARGLHGARAMGSVRLGRALTTPEGRAPQPARCHQGHQSRCRPPAMRRERGSAQEGSGGGPTASAPFRRGHASSV